MGKQQNNFKLPSTVAEFWWPEPSETTLVWDHVKIFKPFLKFAINSVLYSQYVLSI